MIKKGLNGEEKTNSEAEKSTKFAETAKKLMNVHGKEIIYRCPETGQWFTESTIAENYEKTINLKLEVYKNE